MALLGIASPGEGLNLISALFQNQITIKDPKTGEKVYIEAVESEETNLSVNITEHPITDQGSAIDYISRNSTPMTLTGFISNRNLDFRVDPIGLAASFGGSYIPAVTGALAAGVSLAKTLGIDLGKDAIDKKLETLNKWMLSGTFVDVLGMKINAKKFTSEAADYRYLIESIHPMSNTDTGDGAGIQIAFKHVIAVTTTGGKKQGSFVKTVLSAALNPQFLNPFA